MTTLYITTDGGEIGTAQTWTEGREAAQSAANRLGVLVQLGAGCTSEGGDCGTCRACSETETFLAVDEDEAADRRADDALESWDERY